VYFSAPDKDTTEMTNDVNISAANTGISGGGIVASVLITKTKTKKTTA